MPRNNRHKDKYHDVYRVIYELARSVARVTDSQSSHLTPYPPYAATISYIESKGVKPGVVPADKHFDKLIKMIFEKFYPPCEVFSIHKRGVTFTVGDVIIPSSLFDIGNLIKLLPLCTRDRDYKIIYKFVDRVLIAGTGLGMEVWAINKDAEQYYNVIHFIYCAIERIMQHYQDDLDRARYLSAFLFPQMQSVIVPELRQVVHEIGRDYLINPKDYDEICRSISYDAMLLLRYIITIDISRNAWALEFPIVKTIRNEYDPTGLIPKMITDIINIHELLNETGDTISDASFTGVMACLLGHVPEYDRKIYWKNSDILKKATSAYNNAKYYRV